MSRLSVLFLCLLLVVPGFAAARSDREHIVQVAEVSRVVHGNAQSKIYHNSSCRYFNCKACTVVFRSAAEAAAKGFRACRVCGG